MSRLANKFKAVFAVFAYWGGLDAIFFWLNRGRKRVVTFHNVLPDVLYEEMADHPDGITMRASDFRKIVRELARHFRLSPDLEDSESLTITFDDGYRNQGEVAARILESEGLGPGVMFVSGKAVRSCRGEEALVPDRLIFWANYAPEEAIQKVCGSQDRRLLISRLFAQVRDDVECRGEEILRSLDETYSFHSLFSHFSSEFVKSRFTGLSIEDLKDLRRRGWRIGWHTDSHFQLSQLSVQALRGELTAPHYCDQGLLSFPFGSFAHVGALAIKVAKQLNFNRAYSNCVTTHSCHSDQFLPRFVVTGNKYAICLEMSGLKYFLKHLKLLP